MPIITGFVHKVKVATGGTVIAYVGPDPSNVELYSFTPTSAVQQGALAAITDTLNAALLARREVELNVGPTSRIASVTVSMP